MNEAKHSRGLFKALLTGAVMGAAAVVLSDRKKRDKFMSEGKRLIDKLNRKMEDLQDKTAKVKEKTVKKLEKKK